LELRSLAELVGTSKTYVTPSSRIDALIGIDAEFAKGRISAVVGPSGSGKSTLLRLLAGLDRPTAGEVRLVGHDVGGLSSRDVRRLRQSTVTYVFQRPADNLVPHLTLAEHASVESVGDLDLFESFGIAHRLGQRPQALSGGEQARAAFALALMRNTLLVLADEPTAELDEHSAAGLLDAIRASTSEGVGFVLATHDPNVIALADHVVRLDHGRLASTEQHGTPGHAPSNPEAKKRDTVVCSILGVGKVYGHGASLTTAIDDATLDLHRGELAVVVGRSGSGKSTLLSLLAGWQRPDAGSIKYTLNGARGLEPGALRWAQLAMLPQKFGLQDELTVRENVEFPARLDSHFEPHADWIESLIDGLGLVELADRVPSETSIGQQQRTALARALALRPDVLLVDEPTAHQDGRSRDVILELLRRATSAGSCCLVATHETEAATYADTVFEIAEGRLTSRAA
jgi:ABC-type lipoprotein export system ATPase subunit